MASVRVLCAALLLVAASAAGALAQSLEQMAGQMIVVGFRGDSVDDASVKALRDEITAGTLGGVMYLKTNVASLSAVKAMNDAFLDANPVLVPFITIDQEGGMVERLTRDVDFKEVPSAAEVAKTMSVAKARDLYAEMARSLAGLGFNVNFGPVADVDTNSDNPVIAKFGRAFSDDPAVVIDYDRAFIEAHEGAGVLTALKHYPGHGSSTADSHEGFVDISDSWNELIELMPFNARFLLGYADFVMVGHLYHERYSGSDDRLPASLSPEWIGGMLRGTNKFEGVVITDDLEMGAIRKLFSTEETVTRAIRAGVDVLLFSNTAEYSPDLAAEVRAIIVAQAEADPGFAARVRESYERVKSLKLRMALLRQQACKAGGCD